MSEIETARTTFVIEAPNQRVWNLLGRAIFDSMQGLEQMKVIDENNFRANLKVKVFGIPVVMKIRGETSDITPPERLVTKLGTKGLGGLVSLNQVIYITLKPEGEGKTKIEAWAVAEGLNAMFKIALLGQVKHQAKQIFGTIESRLKQWA